MLEISRFFAGPAASIAVLSLTVVLGLGLGHLSLCGLSLGVGGVLFSGMILAHLGLSVNADVLMFARDFGLVLFVFAVGMQVGPGFADSLRRRGLFLNLAAASTILLGTASAVTFYLAFDLPLPVAVGLLSGATTNTPSLAAAAQTFAELAPARAAEAVGSAGAAYAVAYPFGTLGIILIMLLVRVLFRIRPEQELETLRKIDEMLHPPLRGQTFEVRNPNVFSMLVSDFCRLHPNGAALSRVMEAGATACRAPGPETRLAENMLVHAVGTERQLENLCLLLGPRSLQNLHNARAAQLEARRMSVSAESAAGKSVQALGLTPEYGVTVSRMVRAGVEFPPGPGVRLHYGDVLTCVGAARDLDQAATRIGDSDKALEHPHIVSLFAGLLLGTVLGNISLPVPGIPGGIKLGLAGGPLLAALFLSRVNHFAGMVWYLPVGANLILRETGAALFLACVGLNSGAQFFSVLADGEGVYWMGLGACITFFPLLTTAVLVRILLKYDYASLCGLMAGSMTSTPALSYSVRALGVDAPLSVYAGVYPLAVLLRILAAQILVAVLLPPGTG
ncbi:MAG: putative transporter [Desulfovibrio sp.]|jgi:putative transport protein|nr:putative transporter [Desulfovibrio sp.]